MAYSVILSDGTTDYEFVYDAASQADYKMYYGAKVETGEPRALWHTPDDGEPQLIRLVDQPGTIVITQTVKGGGAWDTVINNLIPIKRLVNGKHQQAARYHTDGDVNKVYVRIQVYGATNYTDYTVNYGFVDDSGSYYKSVDVVNTEATGVILILNVAAYGEGQQMALRNNLASSPHFIEDSNADGLADGWNEVDNPTTTIATNLYLIGGQSQKFSTDTSTDQGIESDTVAITGGQTVMAYVWLANLSGDSVVVIVRDNLGLIDSAVFTANDGGGVSDKTAVDAVNSAVTWYRVPVSGTSNGSATTVKIQIRRVTATQVTQCWVDGAYLKVGTTTVPPAWCSTSALQNRYDPTGTSAATEARINYLDVWGVPGDVDAAADVLFDGSSTEDTLAISKLSDGVFSAADINHWNESSSMLLSLTTGSQSSPSDATRSGGTYLRYTAAATPAVGQLEIYAAVGSDEYLKFWSLPHRVFLIARSSNVNTTFKWLSNVGIVSVGGSTAGFNAANTWEILDMGYILPIDRAVYDNFGGSAVAALLIGITPGAGSATTDVDAALILSAPADGLMFVTNINNFPDIRILGSLQSVISDSAFSAAPGVAGSIWTIPPGNKLTRYVFSMFDDSTQVHDLTDTATVTLTITPRTRHLLGTT